MKYPKAVLLAVLAFAVLSPSARADSGDSTIYTFTGGALSNSGNPSGLLPNGEWRTDVNSCSCNITGEFTFASPLDLPVGGGLATIDPPPPSSYSFSVDGYTLNQSNSTLEELFVGQLIPCAGCGSDAWGIEILGNNGLEIFTNCVDGCGDDSTSSAGFINGNGPSSIGYQQGNNGNGTWSINAPEPGMLPMLAVGACLFLLKKPRKCLQE
jgi:hypothetical protein